MREHSPPMVRAATSITEARPSRHPHLGVDRPLDQPERGGGGRGGREHRVEVAGVEARRGDVDGLLEGRPVEGVGLVEDGQDVELARRRRSPSTATSGPGANRSTSRGAPGSTPAAGGDAPDPLGHG